MNWVLILMLSSGTIDISKPMSAMQCQRAMIDYVKTHPEHKQIVRCENRYKGSE